MAERRYRRHWALAIDNEDIDQQHPTLISPPPLKRQRTNLGDGHHASKPTASLAPFRSLQSNKSVENPAASRSRLSLHFASSDSHTSPVHRNREPSVDPNEYGATRANPPSIGGSSKKPVCRVCTKGMVVQYDPIISCPGCRAEFHDSCRKPPLIDGVDPYVVSISLLVSADQIRQRWRCFRCLGCGRKSTPRLTTSHSKLSDSAASFVKRPSLVSNHSFLQSSSQRLFAPDKPMYARSKSIESRRVQEFAEQQISNILHDAYEDDEPATFLDGCADQHKKGDVCLLKEHSDEINPKDSTSFAPSSSLLGDAMEVEKVYNVETFSSSMSPDQPIASDPIMQCFAERTEVPNTPTQRTSQFDLPSSSPKLKDGVFTEILGLNKGTTPIEPKGLANTAFTAVLCSLCQKQRVFAKKGTSATWLAA
jgi:hypothetical protein